MNRSPIRETTRLIVGADVRYGDVLHLAEDKRLYPMRPLDYTANVVAVAAEAFKKGETVEVVPSKGLARKPGD